MAVIGFRHFEGESPKLPPHLVPEAGAQDTQACRLIRGVLEPIKQPLLAFAAPLSPVSAIYTEDGVNFYVWPFEAWPMKSPVIGEQFTRVYWLDKGQTPPILRVSAQAEQQATTVQRPSGFEAGVPTPVTAPALAVMNVDALPDYPNGTWEFSGWWESNAAKYDEVTVTNYADMTQQWVQWQIPLSSFPKTPFNVDQNTGTPVDAVLNVEIRFMSDEKAVMRLSNSVSDSNPATSLAFPGGVEMSVRVDTDAAAVFVELSWGDVETRAYVYTYTNTWNEESAPSPASLATVKYYQQVSVTCPKQAFSSYRPFQDINIYRTFGSNPAYLLITKTLLLSDSAVGKYLDQPSNSKTVPVTGLISQLWSPPPKGLVGAVMMPNGWIAAFKDNILYMSEPYRPHAWPYSMTFTRNIVGLCSGAAGLVVTTVDGCYLVNGVHPANTTQLKLPIPQTGISMRSMANVNGAVAFASPDGIVLVAGSQASLAPANQYFDRDTWKTRYGSMLQTMSFAYYDGGLMAFDSASATGFWLSTDEGQGSTFTKFSLQGTAFNYIPQLDQLYFANGATVYAFGLGAGSSLAWQSKDFVFPNDAGMGIGYIRMDAGTTATIKLYANGVLSSTTTMTQTGYFRLPPGRALRWSIRAEVTGGKVYELFAATTVGELKNA
jgi:hypothetical protein